MGLLNDLIGNEDQRLKDLNSRKKAKEMEIDSVLREIERLDHTILQSSGNKAREAQKREAERKRAELNQKLRRMEEARRDYEKSIADYSREKEKKERLHKEYELQKERIAKERREREEREAKRRGKAHQEESAPGCGCNTIVLILAAILIIFGIVTGVNNLRNKGSEKKASPSAAVTMVQEEL